MAESDSAVAIVGMAATFPGGPDLDTYWSNIVAGVDSITEAPPSRWDPLYYDPGDAGIDRFYCRRGGFLETHTALDPSALGIVPTALDAAEPDQMLVLDLATRALAEAGGQSLLTGRTTGVIVGRGSYLTPGLARLNDRVRTSEQLVEVLRALYPELDEERLSKVKGAFVDSLGPVRADTAIDLVPNLAASRVANRLDLSGPAYTVDAACASALVAVDHAVRELASGRCDLVLAGGVHVCHDVTLWSVFTQLGALSASQQIRPFDRRADGLLIGEGAGMIALERLGDAERRGARIYAVIRGTGISSDGRGASLMRPNIEGQVLALQRAWSKSGLDPSSIGLLEAHGTATPAGDAAELETVRRFFGAPTGTRAVIGSVKSMIGHTMPAAGIAGLIKASLAIDRGVLPPSLHCDEPNSLLPATGFETIQSADDWRNGHGGRVAAVSAFGFGGINAHVVLAQHSQAARIGTTTAGSLVPGTRRRSLTPVGPSNERRVSHVRLKSALLDGNQQDPEDFLFLSGESMSEISAALASAGRHFPPRPESPGPVRLALANPSPERRERARRIVERGKPWRGRGDIWFSPSGLLSTGGKLAFVFPGVEPTFEPNVAGLGRYLDMPLPDIADPNAPADDLEGLGRSIVAVGRLVHAALDRLGLRPDMVAGQSIGEWSGMIATEMIPPDEVDTFIDTLQPGILEVPGVAFATLGCAADAATALLEGLDGLAVSHDNCPHQIIVCGSDADIHTVLVRARRAKILGQLLPFRSGFHTPIFSPFLAPFASALARLPLCAPVVPLWSATTCSPYPSDPEEIRRLALAHLVEQVRFRELTLALHDAGARIFVQVGPGSLPGLIEDTLKGRPLLTIAANAPGRSGLAQLLRVGAACWVEGWDDLRLEGLADPVEGSLTTQPPAPITSGTGLRRLSLGAPLVRMPAEVSELVRQEPNGSTGDAAGVAARLAQSRSLLDAAAAASPAVAAEFRAFLEEAVTTATAVVESFASSAPPATVSTPVTPTPSALAEPSPEKSPHSAVRRVELSLDTVPALADHCFYRQPPGWPSYEDRFPVVPMTALVELMTQAANALMPGWVPIRVEEVRALRWLTVAPPVEVVVRTEEVAGSVDAAGSERTVRVVVEGFARSTVVLRTSFPKPSEPLLPPLSQPDESPVNARDLYADRWLFHGPAYQGVRRLGPLSEDGIDGELETGPAPGALLDNAGQLMGFWLMSRRSNDKLGLPTSIDAIEYFGPPPAGGRRVEVAVRISSVESDAMRARMDLRVEGKLWARIEGWEDRRFDSDEVVWPVLLWPERSLLTEHRHESFDLALERWQSAASRELMMRRYLGAAERSAYAARNPRAQRLFLLGRVAAKDAVRRWLWDHGAGPLWPVEIEISNEPGGAPVVQAPGGYDLRLALAHTPWLGVAIVGEGVDVGIDAERVAPRSQPFARAAFSDRELDILLSARSATERDEWLTRGWSAKEAVAKAERTGLAGRPRDFVITDVEGESLAVSGRRVATTRIEDTVVAWTTKDGLP